MLDKLTPLGWSPSPLSVRKPPCSLEIFALKGFFLVYLFSLWVCVYAGGHMYHSTRAIRGQLAEICSLFSSRGFRGIELRSSGLPADAFSHRTVFAGPPLRFLCSSLLSTVTVERQEVRAPGSAARVGRKPFGGLSGRCQCSTLLWKQS